MELKHHAAIFRLRRREPHAVGALHPGPTLGAPNRGDLDWAEFTICIRCGRTDELARWFSRLVPIGCVKLEAWTSPSSSPIPRSPTSKSGSGSSCGRPWISCRSRRGPHAAGWAAPPTARAHPPGRATASDPIGSSVSSTSGSSRHRSRACPAPACRACSGRTTRTASSPGKRKDTFTLSFTQRAWRSRPTARRRPFGWARRWASRFGPPSTSPSTSTSEPAGPSPTRRPTPTTISATRSTWPAARGRRLARSATPPPPPPRSSPAASPPASRRRRRGAARRDRPSRCARPPRRR